MDIKLIEKETKERINKFNKLRGRSDVENKFWDIVVLTAVDEVQKRSYEIQLKIKLDRKELPLSAKYIVVSDPPGPKIGNGGSTMVVTDSLFKTFGDDLWSKKVIIIHAGGFSQRLPNASVMGKAFLGMPFGEPMYQALELKLASYVDFPQKISSGGIFVCCADTVEVYNDNCIQWSFSDDGITALSHLSPMSIGTTHGVFVLNQPIGSQEIVWDCSKFLHKPSFELMEKTENCVVFGDETESWVVTDSAFFLSSQVAKLLLKFYENNAPLTCEIDAYGDFLQALGIDSSPDYIDNIKNVCKETKTLIETRQKIYDLLSNTSLYVVKLFSTTKNEASSNNSFGSIFYHFGTIQEYQDNFTKNTDFWSILGVGAITFCKGVPQRFILSEKTNHESTKIKINELGVLSCSVQQVKCSTPCIMSTVMLADVSVGQGTIIEYCHIKEGVEIGDDCVISNCSLPKCSSIPNNTFLNTVSVKINDSTKYVTIMLAVDANTKKSVSKDVALNQIIYFGKPLSSYFSGKCLPDEPKASLWNVKIFPLSENMEESCKIACKTLEKINSNEIGSLYESVNDDSMISIAEVLKLKDLDRVLEFRESLANKISL